MAAGQPETPLLKSWMRTRSRGSEVEGGCQRELGEPEAGSREGSKERGKHMGKVTEGSQVLASVLS